MICQICKAAPVKLPMATTCSLKCALSLDTSPHVYDGYKIVRKRLDQAIADGFTNTDKRVKRK